MTPLEARFVAAVAALDLPDRDLVGTVLEAVGDADACRAVTATGPDPGPGPAHRRRRPRASRRARARGDGVVDERRRAARRMPPWVVAMAAAMIVAVVLVTPTRQAVARWLGIGSTRVVVDTAAGGTEELPDSAGHLGPRATGPTIPAGPIPDLGPPAGAFDDDGRGRSYTWPAGDNLPPLGRTGTGLVLSVRPADRDVVTKIVERSADVVFVVVDGPGEPVAALWIAGTHIHVAQGSSRPVVAQQVLLWERDGVEYRLEADLTLEASLALAAGVEGGTDLLAPG